MNTDSEYESLLAPAEQMNEKEAAAHYYNLAEQWYHLRNNQAFKAFSTHIERICKLLESKNKTTKLDAVRALAFVAACPRLHKQLFENNVLNVIVYILGSSPEAANCEAALVVLNHLCTQDPESQRSKFALVSDFCKDKQSLIIIFRYAHVEDRCLSIIANVMSVLAALCTGRPNIQEQCIRAGIMERAFNLKTSHRDRIVRDNVELFLTSMNVQTYSVDKFNEMHSLISLSMGYSSRALCLAIWRLIVAGRYSDALKANKLLNVVQRISEEDPTMEEDWPPAVNGSVFREKPKENKPNKQNKSNKDQHSKPSHPDPLSSSPLNGYNYNNNHHHNHNQYVNGNVPRNDNIYDQDPPDFISDIPNEQQIQHQEQQKAPQKQHKKQPIYPDPDHKDEEIPPDLLRPRSSFMHERKESPNNDPIPVKPNPIVKDKLPKLKPGKSWLEKEIHVAILQTNPIEHDEGSNLALNLERKRLQDVFFKTTRGLKIFFGVLTKDSLIRCIHRGAQIVHISGHGPPERKLKVEDKFGRLEDLSADKIRAAIEKGENKLKLVFVSTCYSQHVAQSFCDAGIPHVVAVHSMVQILDQMATKFASGFYEALIARKCTVEEAFNNSTAELIFEEGKDCCCRHEGHQSICRCPICKIPRCCKLHHQPTCVQHRNLQCCQPSIPHSHSDKFLLLPKPNKISDNIHNERILSDLPNARCERIDNIPPTNIGQASQKIFGRARETQILLQFLHPDSPSNNGDVVFIYGRPKIGLTTLALQVGRFFTRPWYQTMFLGGVFRINLQNCDDPDALYSYIAQAMNITDASIGTYSYWDQKKRGYVPYPEQTQKDLHRALSGDAVTDPIQTFGSDDDEENNPVYPEHFIILDQHKTNKPLLKHILPPHIYQEFEKRIRTLPMEFYTDPNDDDKVLVRRIRYNPPAEDKILLDIKKYGTHFHNDGHVKKHNHAEKNNSFEFQKFLILDHINFPDAKLQQFLQRIKKLTSSIKCKLLICIHDRFEAPIQKIQSQHRANCSFKSRTWRIQPISPQHACKALLDISRQLYAFDFTGIRTPSTAEETSYFPLFKWLAKSPALIQNAQFVLDRKVPFCVIIKMLNAEPNKWQNALATWENTLKYSPDQKKDALVALTNLLTEINVVKSIWSDQIADDQYEQQMLQQQQQQQQQQFQQAQSNDNKQLNDDNK